jgi:RHS repeat-associated protein
LDADGRTLTLRDVQQNHVVRVHNLPAPRIDASITSLPSGRVLIWGGADARGELQRDGFWFDPDLQTLKPAEGLSLSARSAHTATVLTDGRVLFVGGRSNGKSAELWDERSDRIVEVQGGRLSHRVGHQARLLSDGRVRLFGGKEVSRVFQADEWFDPVASQFTTGQLKAEPTPTLGLAGSLPAQGTQNVLPNARLSVRFTQPVRMTELNTASVTLLGPGGAAALKVVPAEDGRLVFATPSQDLFPDSKYTLLIDGVHAAEGKPLPLIAIDFKTIALSARDDAAGTGQQDADRDPAPAVGTQITTGAETSDTPHCSPVRGRKLPCRPNSQLREGAWTPGRDNTDSRWRLQGHQPELMRSTIMARITEAVGFTTVIGRILRVDGVPVANVDVSVGNQAARTDAAGHFTLYNAPSGRQELYVDGTTANSPGAEYGQFVVGVDIEAGKLTQLPYTMYLPRITSRDKVKIASPLAHDVVLTHPDMPGLQVQVPAGTVIRDRKGRLVRELAIVPTPVNRAPFPVADNYPMYFTLEPGGALIQGLKPEAAQGVRVFYPNYDGHPKGTQANFWIYDPAEGWRVYGKGRVTSDGTRFAPEAGVALHQTMGGSYSVSTDDPPTEPDKPPCNEACGSAQSGGGASAGDPIDLKTGEFFYSETDIAIKDIVPLTLSRSYRPHDLKKREFGFGTAANFNYKLYAPSSGTYDTMELVLPSGVPIPFQRISGTGLSGEWRQAGSTTTYNGALLEFVYDGFGHGYRLTFRDGSRMQFGNYAPNPLQWMEDRFGNRTEFAYDAGFVSDIVSPSGRSLSIEYDSNNRIESVTDHTGRAWGYSYNSFGLLDNVTFPDQTYRHYEYKIQSDGISLIQHRVEAVFDQRGHRVLLNEFEPVGLGWSGRVVKQTQADGGVYNIQYDHVDGATTGVLVTQPDGSKRRIVFDASSPYPKTDTVGYGTPLAQTVEFERNVYGQITARTDPLGRRTEYQYNSQGRISHIVYLAGNALVKSIDLAYTAEGDLASITDQLDRMISLTYTNGCATSITNALEKTITLTCNAAGRQTSVTDSLNNTTILHYQDYEMVGITDPAGRSVSFRYDALGRLVATQDMEGNVSRREYDVFDRLSKYIDAAGNATEYEYDANGNLAAVLTPNGNGVTYTYDDRNLQLTRTDGLSQSEEWTYDQNGRVETYFDRNGQTTEYDYDQLGRQTAVSYHDGSTIGAAYDAGNRLLSLTDSLSGVLAWEYDDLDRVVLSTSPQGSIGYEYDAADRRISMTVAGQAKIEYQYDLIDRLQRILQGSEIVEFDYDDANRLIETTLPNGVKGGYAYNLAGQVTGIAWLKPDGTLLGDLGYGYNDVGRQVAQTGSFSSQLLPASSIGVNKFDDNNRQTYYSGQSLIYDDNGNLVSDGARTFVWNARNQLSEIKQGGSIVAAFSYDALGRRYSRTENGQTVMYLHEGHDPVLETRGSDESPILVGPKIDQRFARTEPTGRTYYLTDALGSTRALTNAVGNVVQRYDYSPYGETVQTSGGFTNPYQYMGRERDATGLYYYRARYYSTGMGRFISEDPIGLIGGSNAYRYVSNDPISRNDPLGLVDSVTMACMQQPELCVELFGDITEGQATVQRALGNECAAQYYDALGELAEATRPLVVTAQLASLLAAPISGLTGKLGKVRNGHLADNVHPTTGIPFNNRGFPDFSGVATAEVKITQTGTRAGDYRAANDAAGLKGTPDGFTWHHHEDGTTMQLVPTEIHAKTGHTGGFKR